MKRPDDQELVGILAQFEAHDTSESFSDEAAVAPDETPRPVVEGVPWRLVQVVLFFFCNFICYADRTLISVAIVVMAEDLGWDAAVKGEILSAFFFGYLCTQIAGGIAAAVYGGKPVLLFGVFSWSLFTILTPPAAHTTLGVLLFVRVLMGIGEGVAMPTMHHLNARWVPKQEISRAVAGATSGQYVGTVAAFACAPLAEDWASLFVGWGVVGLVWCGVYWLLGASTPHDHACITDAEVEHITGAARRETRENRSGGESAAGCAEVVAGAPWRVICREPAMWGVVAAHLTNNWGYYVMLMWLPTYLRDRLHVDLHQMGMLSVLLAINEF